MTRSASLRALGWSLVLLSLGGCAGLPFLRDDDKKSSVDASAEAEPTVAQYELVVDAPAALRALLLQYLDISRFQNAPRSQAVTPLELDRLAVAAPAQAKGLLETEGYFNADVTIARSSGDGGLPRLTMTVVPGPQVRVARVALSADPPLAPRTSTREEPWSDRLDHLRRIWALPAGQPFRQSAWSAAKNGALATLRADGYPTASWRATEARIDATDNTAALTLDVDSGPLFRLGEIRVEGTSRFDDTAVRRLATFFPGTVYDERLLLDYQDRLLKVGLYEGASVELDATGSPDAAPVVVRVRELTQQQATFGAGYSANTGPRVSVEHWNRKLFGLPWIAHSTVIFGPSQKLLGSELTSYPLENAWRNLLSANIEQLVAADETRNSATARVGRSLDTNRFARLFYAEVTQARIDNAELTDASAAADVGVQWLRRDLDDIRQPTEGSALALQGSAGYGSGREQRSDVAGTARSKGPFLRAYTRATWIQPFGRWSLNARAEGGEVFVHDRIAVPDTILFRAGGDGSVRGYGYRTLGPTVNGAVVGGRVLATGSVEVEHPLTDRLPALLGALFVDAGNAADRWSELHPALGIGTGFHYRSPVGPLRIDVAYGRDDRRFRLHLSVGVVLTQP